MATEVNHRRPELSQVADHVQRFGRPPGHELKAVSPAAVLELELNRASLLVERERGRPTRVGSQKQDCVLHHRPHGGPSLKATVPHHLRRRVPNHAETADRSETAGAGRRLRSLLDTYRLLIIAVRLVRSAARQAR